MNPAESDAWLEQATTHQGSWWPDWLEWLATRCGERRAAPKALGSRKHKPGGKAPGGYVHAS